MLFVILIWLTNSLILRMSDMICSFFSQTSHGLCSECWTSLICILDMILIPFATILTPFEYEGIVKGVCLSGHWPRLSAEVLLTCAHRRWFSLSALQEEPTGLSQIEAYKSGIRISRVSSVHTSPVGLWPQAR